MRVLGLAGSPRRGSNTDILLDEVLKGAARAGAETKTLVIPNLNIMACQNCDACLPSGACPFCDDWQRVYQELVWADRIVLAAPLHFMGLPSQAKTLVDRAQSLWVKKYLLKLPTSSGGDRRGAFISVAATRGKRLFDGVRLTMRYFLDAIDMAYSDELLVRGVDQKGAIREHPEALEAAYALGSRLVA